VDYLLQTEDKVLDSEEGTQGNDLDGRSLNIQLQLAFVFSSLSGKVPLYLADDILGFGRS